MAGDIITERIFPVTVLAPAADRYDSTPTTDEVNLAKARGVTFLVSEGAGGTGTAVITVEECSDISGTGATAIAFKAQVQQTMGTMGAVADVAATGYTTIAGANKLIMIHVNADQLSAGKTFVRLKFTESVNSPVAAGVVALVHGLRYAKALTASPLV